MTKWLQAVRGFKPGSKWLGVVKSLNGINRNSAYPAGGVLWKKVFLEISRNSQENTCARVFINKENLVQVFPSEFCEISNNIFFTEHPWASASVQFEE